ncbi:hypothetical protein HDU82_000852 [Entophlyctis luteolus]|nr:hypothetical protein HDU82_000852 [Entophlyctis luteolus]KAJ3379395.1 hypothetical protein HDU84_006707 [Entophlyctis sp. JEL0112]
MDAVATKQRTPLTLAQHLLVSAFCGALASLVALALKVPNPLEAAPDHAATQRGSGRMAVSRAAMRGSAGFAVFFALFEALKRSPSVKITQGAKAGQRDPAAILQNIFAAIVAAAGYRATTWAIEGSMPVRQPKNEEEVVYGGTRGENPYAPALAQLKTSVIKACVAMVAMDAVFGRPSWG